jgi:hypothetical protein
MCYYGYSPGIDQGIGRCDCLGCVASVIGSDKSQGVGYSADVDTACGIRLADGQLDGVSLGPA